MENQVILGTSNKALQQVMLNVNGNMQLVQLPEDSNITTLGGLLPHINNYLPQSADKYRLIIAETQTDLIGNESSLPVEKAKLVKNADGSTAFTLGLYALPIQSKAGGMTRLVKKADGMTRNELVSAVKAIIVADPTAKEFFTVEGKQYNMLKTDVLTSRYEDYNARVTKGKAAKTKAVKIGTEKHTAIAEVVESVKKAKTVKTKITPVTETVVPIAVPVTVEEVVAPVELIGSTKQQLIASIEAIKSMINGVADIVASLPDAVVEVAETKTAIEEVIYSFDEYLNSMRSNYVPLCKRLPNTRC